MRSITLAAPALAALLLTACAATSTQLTLMPRDSGKLYSGYADGTPGYEGRVSITIENKTYTGTWVTVVSDRSYGWVGGGWGYGRYGGWGAGAGTYHVDNPNGGEAKALLTAQDGSGLRCDFRGSWGQGGGLCRDDRGREYDVQMRPAPPKG
jgi:hypothetical protein